VDLVSVFPFLAGALLVVDLALLVGSFFLLILFFFFGGSGDGLPGGGT
jgi:hypothetical protein